VRFDYVAALLVGGLIAAPIAAYMVRHLNPRLLGVVVGGFICFTNARVTLGAADIGGEAFLATYAAIVIIWVAAIVYVVSLIRRESRGARSSR
jgi:mannitol-specific phosphotransferase system IIBC component